MLQIALLAMILAYMFFAFKHKAYLNIFYNICFLLPCAPLINAIYHQDSAFWSGDTYNYPYDSLEVQRLTLVCITSVLSAIVINLFYFINSPRKTNENYNYSAPNSLIALNNQSLLTTNKVFTFLAIILVLIRLSIANKVEQLLPGYELLTMCSILFSWVPFIMLKRINFFIIPFFLTCFYAYSQILSGDRDFLVIVISLVLYYIGGGKVKFKTMIIVMPTLVLVMFVGTIISMERMNIDLNAEEVLEYLTFNSWNATIQPVLTILPDYWYSDSWLYGKTYIDLILSAAPSPLYLILGTTKPITLDNPADWFYVVGMGGMHAAGVALRNFGLYGVFLQGLFLNWFYFKADKMRKNLKNFKEVFLYLILASSVMHTTWYGLITLLNTFVLYLLFIIVIYVMGRFNLKSDLKFGEKKCVE